MLKAIGKNYQFYANAVVRLLIEPGPFFTDLSQHSRIRRAAAFLVAAALFYAVASLLTMAHGGQVPWKMGMIFFANALGTAVAAAVIGYITLVMVTGKKASFQTVFRIYAFSSGITLFISWLPFLLWLTEPWRWWLVYTGFKNSCNVTWKKALCVVVLSLGIQVGFTVAALEAFGPAAPQ